MYVCKSRFRLLALIGLFTLTLLLAVDTPAAYGNGGDNQLSIPEKTELKYPNLGSTLDQMAATVEEGELSARDAAKDAPVSKEESVAVTIYLSGNVDEVVTFLEDNGGDPRNIGEDYIEAYVPVTLVGQLSEQPGVLRVREIIPPQPIQTVRRIFGHGPPVHGSAVWNQAGYSGQGIKVGIIDLGFKDLTSLMGTELPARIQGRCYTDIGVFTQNLADCEAVGEVTVDIPECLDAARRGAVRNAEHGTIVAESVIDIAPEVSLYIANPHSQADLQNTAEWMASEGVSVINYSVVWLFDGPGNGTSPFSVSPLRTVDRAVANDIIWVNAAGNSAQETWFGGYSDPDGDGATGFGGQNDEVIDMPLTECQPYLVQLRWEDDWGGASTDLDLHLYNIKTQEFVFSSDTEQSGGSGHVPFEAFGFRARIDSRDFGIAVTHYGGSVPDWIQLTVWGVDPIQHHTGRGSISNPAESANDGMLAVGAAPWYDPHTIEYYSSRGPTPDGREKPDIVGAACGETTLTPLNESGRGFCGTSQAAPHVAGMAALVRQRFPDYSPVQVADYLKDNAELRELPDPGNTWGHGFAELPPLSPSGTLPTVVFANMNWDSVQLQNRIARYIVENGYDYPTNLVSGSSATMLQGLRDGDIDVAMEIWLPNQSLIWNEALATGKVLSLGTSLGSDWQSAFVIPAYLQEQYPGLDSVEDLKDSQYKRLFATANSGGKARLVSCVVGWACEAVNRAQIEGYGLADHIHIVNPRSETDLHNSIYDAYESQEPWLGFQWGTSDPALLLDLARLEEPEYSDECWRTTQACAHEDDTILIGANSDLPAQARGVVEFLRQWDFEVDPHLKNVAKWQESSLNASIEDAAQYWLENNVDTWSNWVTPEASAGILAAVTNTPSAATITPQIVTDADSMTVAWSAPNHDGGYPITGYDLRYILTNADETVESNWTVLEEVWAAGGGSLQYVITGLTGGTQYDVQVRAVNAAAGTGLWSATAIGTTAPPVVPGAPQYLTAGVAVDEARVDLSWIAPISSGGALITGYKVESSDDGGVPWVIVYTTTGAATSYTDLGTDANGPTFEVGTMRDYRVSAINSVGTGPPSNVAIATPDACRDSLGLLTAPVTKTGTWADDCDSDSVAGQANNYARYYTFTLAGETRVAIYLTSSRDTYLYLREGEGKTGTVVHQNNNVGRGNINSRIEETLADGTYTVEATTYYRRGVTGDFTLDVRPVVCVQQLGTLTETHTTPGAWSDDCDAGRQPNNYHRSYSFTLGAPTDLQIDLTSERDTYLYLLREDGTVLDQNNNVGRGNINSRIVQTGLAAGTYTVEATTYYRNPVTGNFVLNIGLIR